jgi:hypothetical protein
MVGVLLFGHKTQGLCFCYIPNSLHGINLSAKYWIIQIMLIFMVMVIFQMCM